MSSEGSTPSDPWTREVGSQEISDGWSICCCCLSLDRTRYHRGRTLSSSSNLEEHACLVECDELEQFRQEEDDGNELERVGLHND